jgi:hypothetical protein
MFDRLPFHEQQELVGVLEAAQEPNPETTVHRPNDGGSLGESSEEVIPSTGQNVEQGMFENHGPYLS